MLEISIRNTQQYNPGTEEFKFGCQISNVSASKSLSAVVRVTVLKWKRKLNTGQMFNDTI